MIEKLALAVRAGVAESVTVAVKYALRPKVAVPESTPVFGSILRPSTNWEVDDILAILQCNAP